VVRSKVDGARLVAKKRGVERGLEESSDKVDYE
jgi:hypothetical protein